MLHAIKRIAGRLNQPRCSERAIILAPRVGGLATTTRDCEMIARCVKSGAIQVVWRDIQAPIEAQFLWQEF